MVGRLGCWTIAMVGSASLAACGGSSTTAVDVDGGTGSPDGPAADVDGGNGGNVDSGSVDSGVSFPDAYWPLSDAGQPMCMDKATGQLVVCQCSDGVDNADTDDLADALDPECSGPFDNDESSFATGIPGDNSDKYVQDCFFDGDSGGGNDGCRWDIRCVPDAGSHCNNNQLSGCDSCKKLTPNGCDCFGCCDVYVSGVAHRVRIVEGCTGAVINDPNLCPPCDFVTDCVNPCDPCVEQCLGDVPPPEQNPACQGVLDAGTPPPACPAGVNPCGTNNTCPEGYACITGCCQYIVP